MGLGRRFGRRAATQPSGPLGPLSPSGNPRGDDDGPDDEDGPVDGARASAGAPLSRPAGDSPRVAALAPPLVIVNVKTYPQATGRRLEIFLDDVAGVAAGEARLAFAVQAADLHRAAADARELTVLAQHVDPDPLGSHTGATAPEAVRDAGAVGSLVNHAERQLALDDVRTAVARLGDLDLASVVCADDLEAARQVAATGPDMVAIEPPELIGGEVSVTTADPGIISDGVEAVRGVDDGIGVLCGAGVKTGDDVAKAIELGADGVLLASGVVKARGPAKVLEELLEGLER